MRMHGRGPNHAARMLRHRHAVRTHGPIVFILFFVMALPPGR
jgi:hypothetical protein